MRCRHVLAMLVSLVPVAGRAEEGITPYLPGATTGVPVGALPPPGYYATEDNYVVFGELKGGKGQSIPVRVTNSSVSVALLWSSSYHILGAQYGAGIVQIGAYHQADTTGLGGSKTGSFGLFNTILEPLILSWEIGNGLFVSTGQSFYLPNGEFHHDGGARLQTSYANAFWTYEPSVAVSYLKNGWNLTAENIFDVNAKNGQTDYKSGNVYYLDLTAKKTIGGLSLGAIGNYTQQISDDYQFGKIVGDGNRDQHIMLGPLLEYNFGPVNITARYLNDVRTRNDIALHMFHLSFSASF